MRSSRIIQVGPKSNDNSLVRDRRGEDTDTKRMPREDRDRDWN